MTAKEVLIKNTDTTVIHNSGVYGRTMISEECVLKAMDEYAKQKAWEVWKMFNTDYLWDSLDSQSESYLMEQFRFLKWWEDEK